MKIHKLKDFKKGWFIGDFDPSLFKTTGLEIAVKKYIKGEHETSHMHKIATEYTVIINGTAQMNGVIYTKGDIVEIFPGEYTDFKAVTDTTTLVIKIPSIKGDKYE